MLNEMNGSGSSRDKMVATPKQNKWKDPFYCESHGRSRVLGLYNHKIDSIRDHVSNNAFNGNEPKGFFKMIGNAVRSFFGLFSSRKGIA